MSVGKLFYVKPCWPSSSFHTGTVPASPAHSGTHCSGSSAAWPCDSGCPRFALVTSRQEDPIQVVLAGLQVAFGTHVRLHLGPCEANCQNSGSIYTTRLVMWQPCHAADTSMNRRQSFFCCCTTSMEQAANGAEAAAIDGLVLSWFKNNSVWFCLRAPGYGLTLWCTLGLRVAGAIQVPQLQLQLQ